MIAATGQPLPPPDLTRLDGGWVGGPGRRPAWAIALRDGRWLVVRLGPQFRPPPIGLVALLALVAAGVAIAAVPAVRRLTRRLERLQQGVEALGAGNLAARVAVEGRDEVAKLARSFNASAERIEALVGAHRTLLANASHELRSPLARIQMGVDLLKRDAKPELAAELERNVRELDQLVDEILLASRLDALPTDPVREPVDLLALAAEECARVDASLDGQPVTVMGEPRLLRRLIRNLLENARRYGDGSAITVSVRATVDATTGAARAQLTVADGGPGVAASERERIFEPFYRPAGASERGGGVGLGLSLVRTIARRHGGDARYQPREPTGASFEVALASV